MNLRVLKYFIAIAEEGSISKAALRLRVAQPALSQHIRKLERDLGTELLLRTAHGVTPTESGVRFLDHARELSSHLERVWEDVRGHVVVPVGPVVIGMTQSIAGVLALPLFRETRRLFPGISIRFSESSTGHMPGLLRQRQMDLAVLFRSQNDPTIRERPVLEEDLCLVGPPRSSTEGYGTSISFAEAAALPLLLPGGPHSVRELINGYARKRSLKLNVVAEIDAVPQLKEFVAAGMGHTILAPASVDAEVVGGRLSARPIVSPIVRRRMILCRSADVPASRATLAIADLVVRLAQDLVRSNHWPARVVDVEKP